MTGPEHYAEAERLLEPGVYDDGIDAELVARDIARAQVHATLALAAATALNMPHPEGGLTQSDWEAWIDAASAYKRPGVTP